MCNITNEKESKNILQSQQRRLFLKLFMASTLGARIAATGGKVMATSGSVTLPPQPENVLMPEAALGRLIAGNERYVSVQPKILSWMVLRVHCCLFLARCSEA